MFIRWRLQLSNDLKRQWWIFERVPQRRRIRIWSLLLLQSNKVKQLILREILIDWGSDHL